MVNKELSIYTKLVSLITILISVFIIYFTNNISLTLDFLIIGQLIAFIPPLYFHHDNEAELRNAFLKTYSIDYLPDKLVNIAFSHNIPVNLHWLYSYFQVGVIDNKLIFKSDYNLYREYSLDNIEYFTLIKKIPINETLLVINIDGVSTELFLTEASYNELMKIIPNKVLISE